jgi:hypothetical protein
MGRPPGARKALGRFPLVEARRAHFSGIERVPFESASAEPLDFVAGRPAAEKTADARRFRSGGLLLFFKLWNNDRIVGDRTHDGYYDLRPKARGQT